MTPYMTPYEVYVLCKNRTELLATHFLDHFLPQRTPAQDEYPLPELVDAPIVTFDDTMQLIRRLESDPEQTYGLYWNRIGDEDPCQAMLFFTCDGGMIAGLASTRSVQTELIIEIAKEVDGEYGFVTGEERPPDTTSEFLKICRNSELVRLVNRQLLT